MSLSLTCGQQPHMPPLVKHADGTEALQPNDWKAAGTADGGGPAGAVPPRFLSLRAHEGHLARKLERRLVRLGAAVAKEHLVQVLGGLDHHLC